jgi:putative transposase
MYLVAILDWFSRYIVAWELDDTLELPFVLVAVDRALERARPVIWNSFVCACCAPPRMKMRILSSPAGR